MRKYHMTANGKKRISCFLTMLMMITLIAPMTAGTTANSARRTVKLRKITLNRKSCKLQKGKKLKLKASFKPKKTTQRKITWRSSKKKIASVSKKGVVKALRVGRTTITARVKGTKKKAICKIQVVTKNSAGNGGDSDQDNPSGKNPSADLPPVSSTLSPVGSGTPAATSVPGQPVASKNPASTKNPDQTTDPGKEPTTSGEPSESGQPTGPTQAPPSKQPTSAAPTQAAASKSPTTAAPASKKPATAAPASKKPATAAPASKKPATAAPASKRPATAAPASKKPTTAAPATNQPTSAAPTTSPKYERPDSTAKPVNRIDLTADGAFHNESPNGANIATNADGSITVTFSTQYAAINFFLPDDAQTYYSEYKSVVLTYTSEGGALSHALFDSQMEGAGSAAAGKHPEYSNKIIESKTENTLVFNVTDACVGGCIRGFQIFNLNDMSDGKTISITIKSLTFCDKENPTAEDLIPPATATPTPTKPPAPIITREPGPYGISNPATEGDEVVWDLVTFGTYYQSLYEPKQAPDAPTEGAEYTDSDGTKLKYIGGQYYKKEPIQWRVLSVDGDDALIVANQSLASMPYDSRYSDSTSWEESEIRQWLNGDFYASAFDDSDRSTIRSTTVSEPTGSDQSTAGATALSGETRAAATTDNVYLLSLADMNKSEYGFSVDFGGQSKTRQATNTAYAKAVGAWTNDSADFAENGWWWLRTPGSFTFDAAYVGSEGSVDHSGYIAVNTGGGVRPALHIDLRSAAWNIAGTIRIQAATDLIPTPVPTENPVKQVDLSAVSADLKSCGYFDDSEDTIHVNDTRTGDGDSTFMYLPIPVTVAPGEKLRVTISGSSWGDNDFRIWTTPQGGEGSGDFVDNAQIFLNPTVNADGSFTGTVELTAKGKECNRITLKANWGVKIKNLIITEITVELLKKPTEEAAATSG